MPAARRLMALASRSALVVTLTMGVQAASADAPTVDQPARAAQRAARGAQWDESANCDLTTVRALAGRHPGVRQFVVLATQTFADTHGSAFVAVRLGDGTWRCATPATSARFGRSGTRPLILRRSGDGTTPAGVFPLGTTTAWDGQRFSVFGNRPDPGVRAGVGYRRVRAADCWGATQNTARYNHLVADQGCTGPDEWLPRFGDVYGHAAVIGANTDPVSGDAPGEIPYAAAIFLHRHSYGSTGATRPTSGCVSLAHGDLVAAVRALDPTLDPHFAIGPTSWLRSTA